MIIDEGASTRDEVVREHTRIVMRAYNRIEKDKSKERKAKRKQAKASRRRNNV